METKKSVIKRIAVIALVFAVMFLFTVLRHSPKNPWRLATVHAQSSAATLAGTGACATIVNNGGNAFAGTFKCTGTTGASTVTISPTGVAPNGWQCLGSDTTTAAVGNQTAPVATNSCKLNFASVTANDILTYEENPF